MKVADAVQAAHSHAIIHCDLKPANVIVDAATGEPKVLDFGIARIATDDSTTWQTTAGVLLGTPGYMSPEQASANNRDLDVRSDVYALGVMLFELLTGQMPLDLQGLTIHETLRRIEESNSKRLASIDPTLDGDLDVICDKAMSRDKQDRYATAAAFADDLRRYLSEQPILAQPPSTWYVACKFARRNRGKLIVAGALLGTLVAGVIASTIGFVRAEQQRKLAASERDRAEAQTLVATEQRDRAEELRRLAEAASTRSQRVSAFLKELLESPDPSRSGKDVTVLDTIRRMEPQIAERFHDSPTAEAEVRLAIAQTLFELGDYHLARKQYERGIELLTTLQGPLARPTLRARTALVEVARWQNRPVEAKELVDQLLIDAKTTLSPEDPDLLPIFGAQAGVLRDLERWNDAIDAYKRLIETRTKVDGPQGEGTLTAMSNLAEVYMSVERYDEAGKLLADVIAGIKATAGERSPRLLVPEFNLAQNIHWSGRHAEALPLLEKCLHNATATLGEAHDHTMIVRKSIVECLSALGRHEEALKQCEEALTVARRAFGDTSERTLMLLNTKATILLRLERPAEAVEILRPLVQALDATQAQAQTRSSTRRNLATALGDAGQLDESLRELNAIHDEFDVKEPASYGACLTLNARAQTLYMLDRYDEAEHDMRQAVEGFTKANSSFEAALSRRGLARILVKQKRFDEAERELLQAAEVLKGSPDSVVARKTAQAFVALYDAWGKPDRADPYRSAATTRPATRPH
ncbi:MAG: serine/threonine-protein kinase [Tepidisphaeraceae bacterium]